MTSDKYLLLTCKHTPHRRIQIGSGKHTVTQWRCACGKIVPLTDLQIMYVSILQSLLSERALFGTLSDEQEATICTRLNDYRNRMTKVEEEPLDTIAKATVESWKAVHSS